MITGGYDEGVDDDDDDNKVRDFFCLNSSNRAVQHHKHTYNSNYILIFVCLCLFFCFSAHSLHQPPHS